MGYISKNPGIQMKLDNLRQLTKEVNHLKMLDTITFDGELVLWFVIESDRLERVHPPKDKALKYRLERVHPPKDKALKYVATRIEVANESYRWYVTGRHSVTRFTDAEFILEYLAKAEPSSICLANSWTRLLPDPVIADQQALLPEWELEPLKQKHCWPWNETENLVAGIGLNPPNPYAE